MVGVVDVLQLVAIFGLGSIGLVLIRDIRALKDEIHLLDATIRSRLPITEIPAHADGPAN